MQLIIEPQTNVLSILQSNFMKDIKPLGSLLVKERNQLWLFLSVTEQMGWAKTLLCTLTHTSVRFQTACTSLSTEKSYCKNRSLIQSVTFTPSVSHLLCNMRIFFTGEEFPFIDSKCENHSYCPVIESKSAWLPSPHLCISTRPSARITGSRGVGSAPGKTLSLPTASSTQHSTAQSALPTQGLQKSNPQVVFSISNLGQFITEQDLVPYSLKWVAVISNALVLKKELGGEV